MARIADITKNIPKVSVRCLTAPTLDVRAPCRYVSHPFGFEELIIDIPDDARTIAVHMTVIHANNYVSFLEFLKSGDAHRDINRKSSTIVKIDFPPTAIHLLRFVVDGLGIRSLKFGNSPWIVESPESIQNCWEGFSMRRTVQRIRIVRDVRYFQLNDPISKRNSDETTDAQVSANQLVSN